GMDLAATNAGASWTIPLPAVYLIAQDRRIAWAYVDPDYLHRAEPETVPAELERLRRGRTLEWCARRGRVPASGLRHLVRRRAAVAGAAHGQHVAGICGVGLDTIAQPVDVRVDVVRVGGKARVPHRLQQLRPREHPARRAHQQREQVELARAQRQFDAIAPRAPAVRFDLERAEHEARRRLRRRPVRARAGQPLDAAQQRLDARTQLDQ